MDNQSETFTPYNRTVQVECQISPRSFLSLEEIKILASDNIPAIVKDLVVYNDDIILKGDVLFPFFKEDITEIRVISIKDMKVPLILANFTILPYRLAPNTGFVDFDDENDGPESSAIRSCELPNKLFHGLWQSLVYEDDIKDHLVSYVDAVSGFDEKGVDSMLVSLNRLVLLYGPPGTGKTSLIQALAHHMSIRLGSKYDHVQLLELNCHGIFSRWFSESSKSVVKAFNQVLSLAQHPSSFLFLLVDEVESVAMNRNSSLGGHEPTDGIRVVNTLLTQLDKLRSLSNVVVLTTSNMKHAIDGAFVDRADLHLKVDTPAPEAIYNMVKSAINELFKKDVIVKDTLENNLDGVVITNSPMDFELKEISLTLKGLSGRQVRKLPFLAYASCIRKVPVITVSIFLEALKNCAIKIRI